MLVSIDKTRVRSVYLQCSAVAFFTLEKLYFAANYAKFSRLRRASVGGSIIKKVYWCFRAPKARENFPGGWGVGHPPHLPQNPVKKKHNGAWVGNYIKSTPIPGVPGRSRKHTHTHTHTHIRLLPQVTTTSDKFGFDTLIADARMMVGGRS